MLSRQSIQIAEEYSAIQPPNRNFRFLLYRTVKHGRQEMIVVRLSKEMVAGKEMWELIKATQEELQDLFHLDAISTLGAVSNCTWTSTVDIYNAQLAR